jgi:pimeloyl-ACP methyl ester carboxylesterase
VVLIHGLSWPSPVWDGIARGLVDQGMRVLLYDLYGRGYTQAPDVPHTMSFYVEQLSQLLEHIGWEKTIVIGLSMGGAIATGFTAKYPEKVQRLGLVAPAGLMSVRY